MNQSQNVAGFCLFQFVYKWGHFYNSLFDFRCAGELTGIGSCQFISKKWHLYCVVTVSEHTKTDRTLAVSKSVSKNSIIIFNFTVSLVSVALVAKKVDFRNRRFCIQNSELMSQFHSLLRVWDTILHVVFFLLHLHSITATLCSMSWISCVCFCLHNWLP